MLSEQKIRQVNALLTQAFHVAQRDKTRLALAERDTERLAIELEALAAKPTRTPAKPKPAQPRHCGKRWYKSEAAAKAASASLAHTVRTYRCPDCSTRAEDVFHFTKRDYA